MIISDLNDEAIYISCLFHIKCMQLILLKEVLSRSISDVSLEMTGLLQNKLYNLALQASKISNSGNI